MRPGFLPFLPVYFPTPLPRQSVAHHSVWLRSLGVVASHHRAICAKRPQHGHLFCAPIGGEWAPRAEAAPARWVEGRRRLDGIDRAERGSTSLSIVNSRYRL